MAQLDPLTGNAAPAAPVAAEPAGFFESGGGMMAFVALIGCLTCLNAGGRPPAPVIASARLTSPAPVAAAAPVEIEAVAPTGPADAAASLSSADTTPPAAPQEEIAAAPALPSHEIENAAAETPRLAVEAVVPAATAAPVDETVTSAIPKPVAEPVDSAHDVGALQAADQYPPSFEFGGYGGKIRVSGVVADKMTGAALLDDLKAVFGAGSVTGAIAVDPRRAQAAWLMKMPSALNSLKSSGLTVLFSGDDVVLRGRASEAERARLSSALPALFGGGVKVVSLGDHLDAISARANAHVEASLASLQPGFSAADLVGVLNLSIVNFASASAEIPENDQALLGEAAALFRQIPRGALIEISGHTDSTGDATENVALSKRRAEAVRAALVKAGVSPAMLIASGYGGAVPVAANESVEGRFRNRRIEYRLARP